MSDRWQQIMRLLAAAERGDDGFRYAEPQPDASVAADPHQQRAAEAAIWSELIDRASGSLRPHPGFALDAGCGMGVHLPELARRYRRVLAIDADPQRIADLRATWSTAQPMERNPVRGVQRRAGSGSVACATLRLQDAALRDPLLQGQFALVHCIQVLGHVATSDLALILDTFGRLLAPEGHLLLAVPFTNRDRDDFRVAARQEDGSVRGHSADQRGYDRLVAAPEPGQLPVHHFALPTLQAALRSVGLVIEAERPYNWFSYEHADLMLLAHKRAQ